MSGSERPSSSSSAREFDPLLKDLSERKQSFWRNVVSLAAELKEVRSRLASQEQSFARETLTRQEAEVKAMNMEEEICRLQKSLEKRNGQFQASASTAEKQLKELDDLRSRLSATQATADASAASAQSAQLQCLVLLKVLDEKNSSLKELEDRVNRLGEQFDLLQNDLQAREFPVFGLNLRIQAREFSLFKQGQERESAPLKFLRIQFLPTLIEKFIILPILKFINVPLKFSKMLFLPIVFEIALNFSPLKIYKCPF